LIHLSESNLHFSVPNVSTSIIYSYSLTSIDHVHLILSNFYILNSAFSNISFIFKFINIFFPSLLHVEKDATFLNLEGRFRFNKMVVFPIFRLLPDYLFFIIMSLYLSSISFFQLFFNFSISPVLVLSFFKYIFCYRLIPFHSHSEFYIFIYYYLGLSSSNKLVDSICPSHYFFKNILLKNNIFNSSKCYSLTRYFDFFSKSLSIASYMKNLSYHSSFVSI